MTEQLRDAVVAAARAAVGTPWIHQGRRPGIGLDCVGLLVLVAETLRMPCRDQQGYSPYPDGVLLVDAMLEHLTLLDTIDDARHGDVVVFRIRKHPQHVAILADRSQAVRGGAVTSNRSLNLVHAMRPPIGTAEHIYDTRWRDRAMMALTWPWERMTLPAPQDQGEEAS